ncbi:MAG: hypothetical protein GC162_06385 [Planctomycetes bacterium]|nr:hypothetical protein [Planctomycetota bacterium]
MQRTLLAGCCVLMIMSATVRAADSEVEQLRKENAALKARVAELEKQLGVAQQQNQQLVQEKQAIVQQQTQDKADARAYYLAKDYDGDENETEIASRVLPMQTTKGGTLRRHWLSLADHYKGKERSGPPASVDLYVQTYATGIAYRDVEQIVFNVGAESIVCPVKHYSSSMRAVPTTRRRERTDDETVKAELSIDNLKKLAAAPGEIVGHMGTLEFTISREQANLFRAMVDELGVK